MTSGINIHCYIHKSLSCLSFQKETTFDRWKAQTQGTHRSSFAMQDWTINTTWIHTAIQMTACATGFLFVRLVSWLGVSYYTHTPTLSLSLSLSLPFSLTHSRTDTKYHDLWVYWLIYFIIQNKLTWTEINPLPGIFTTLTWNMHNQSNYKWMGEKNHSSGKWPGSQTQAI